MISWHKAYIHKEFYSETQEELVLDVLDPLTFPIKQ